MHVWITILLVAGGAMGFGLGVEQPAGHAAQATVMQAPEAPGPMFGPVPTDCCRCHGQPVCRVPGMPAPRSERAANADDFAYIKAF